MSDNTDTVVTGSGTDSTETGVVSSGTSVLDTLKKTFGITDTMIDRFFTGTKIGLDALHSGNASNLRGIKRLQLKYKSTELNFAINPSDYTQKFPNRVSMTQTKGGAWLDTWGAGIVEINIRGVTGVSGRKNTQRANPQDYMSKFANTALDLARVISGDSGVDEGYQRWRKFRDLFKKVYDDGENGAIITDDDLIILNNYTDNEYWFCYPMPNGLELYRSQSKPHMYQYTINLWGLKPQTKSTNKSGVIGDPKRTGSTTANGTDVESGSTSEDSLGDGVESGSSVEGELDDTATQTGESGSQTGANSNVTVSGGVSYYTQAAALNTEADTVTTTSTKTKNVNDLRADSEEFANDLAPIIGGYNGLLVPASAYATAKDLSITELGAVLNATGFDKNQIFKIAGDLIPSNRLLEEMRFAPLVSSDSYKIWKKILNYSSEILTPEFSRITGTTVSERIKNSIKTSEYYGSTLYEYINMYKSKYYLTQTDIIYLKIILLECMTLYVDLYKIVNSSGKVVTLYTCSDINTLIKNIQAMCIYLQFSNSEMNLFYIRNVIWELRKIETVLHQIKTYVLNYL